MNRTKQTSKTLAQNHYVLRRSGEERSPSTALVRSTIEASMTQFARSTSMDSTLSSPSIEYLPGTSTNSIPISRRLVSTTNLQTKSHLHPDFRSIFETILPCIDSVNPEGIAARIAEELHRYFQTLDTHITGLRTLSVAKFLQEVPIIEWREGRDVDVLGFLQSFKRRSTV
jgi:hypothetical protein